LSTKEEGCVHTLRVIPMVCSPQPSVQATIINLKNTAALGQSENWVLSQIRPTGFWIAVVNDYSNNVKNRIEVCCSILDVGKIMMSFQPVRKDKLQEACQALNYINTKDICSNPSIDGADDDGIPVLGILEKMITHLVVQGKTSSKAFSIIATSIYKALSEKPEDTFNESENELIEFCKAGGELKNNGYLRTAILLQCLCPLRIQLKTKGDVHELTAKTLKAFGCFPARDVVPFKGSSFQIFSESADTTAITSFADEYLPLSNKMKITVYMHDTTELLKELKVSNTKTLADILDNINKDVYNCSLSTSILSCTEKLCLDVRPKTRAGNGFTSPFPPDTLREAITNIMSDKDVLQSCSCLQYVAGHKMLEMIKFYFFDVLKEATSFTCLSEQVLLHVTHRANHFVQRAAYIKKKKAYSKNSKDKEHEDFEVKSNLEKKYNHNGGKDLMECMLSLSMPYSGG